MVFVYADSEAGFIYILNIIKSKPVFLDNRLQLYKVFINGFNVLGGLSFKFKLFLGFKVVFITLNKPASLMLTDALKSFFIKDIKLAKNIISNSFNEFNAYHKLNTVELINIIINNLLLGD